MIGWITRRVRQRDERGAALVLVLIIISAISLALTALLTMADTSVRATVELRDQAASTYQADGAMQAAINNIRKSNYSNAPGQHCFGSSDTLQLSGFYGSDSAAVTCEPDPHRVLIHCPSLANCNRPGSAILTLGRIAGEDGINVKALNSPSRLLVHGAVFSNSNINVPNGALETNTRLYARGACTGTVVSSPPPACNYGNGAHPLGDDPGYAADISLAPVHRSLPACTTQNSLVTFEPGYYDDAEGLTQMMKGGGSPCRGSIWWFKPGAYYFDFHNVGPNANPLLDGSDNVWTVDNGYLIAGTPVNAAGTPIATPQFPVNIPGACDNPIKNAAAVGVQFIFGGSSQFAIKAGHAEICGTYSTNRPPLAVYGLTSGTETVTSLVDPDALKLASVTDKGDFGASATTANLVGADASYARWTADKANDTTTLTVDGFAPPTPIPAGSILQSAKVRVKHRHTHVASTDNLEVTVTPSGGSALPVATATGFAGTSTFQTTLVPLDTAADGSLARAVYNGTFTSAKIAVKTKLSANADLEDIDTVQLELRYTAPAFRAGSGCVATGPYDGGSTSSCALITSVNNSGNEIYIQGTTYIPGAVADLTLNNVAEQVFRFGVIARSLWVKITGSVNYTGPVIEVPDDSPGFVFSVYLDVHPCAGAGLCATTGTPALRSKVAFVDSDPVHPVPGDRQVAVLSWSSPG